MAKITKKKPGERETITVKTGTGSQDPSKTAYAWWNAGSQRDLASQLTETASFLKVQQQYRFRQASIWARMYGNLPLANYMGAQLSKTSDGRNLPIDRPTFNVVQSCVDTKVARIIQNKPRPVFLTDNGDYRQRKLAKQLNGFMEGEFYQAKAYKKGEMALRDADVIGTGVLKVVRTTDNRVGLERRLVTELLVDANDAMYGEPRNFYEFKLVDREVAMAMFPDAKGKVTDAEQSFPDTSRESSETTSDQIMLVEGWRLPSSKDAGDGMHAIACTAGLVDSQPYNKMHFPFAILHSNTRLLGMWGQGCPERLMGIQVEINKLLMTISKSINLVGVPRIFQEAGSKVPKASYNNEIGTIITYQGTKPSYEVAACMPQEVYAQLQRLIESAYQVEGVSQLAASSIKPSGLDSGEAQREYDANQQDRLATLSKAYTQFYVDLSYLMLDQACDIAEDTGSYSTIYPNKDGTREVDLPSVKELTENPYVIQAFDSASLPTEPAGRKQTVIEYMQAGILNQQEGRRLLDFPDLEQVEKLANAGEERILKQLDDIVENGKFDPPDPFTDLSLAETLATQYYNLYVPAKLGDDKSQLLRDYFTQVQDLKQAAQPPPEAMPGAAAQAVPQAPAVSPMLPNAPQ